MQHLVICLVGTLQKYLRLSCINIKHRRYVESWVEVWGNRGSHICKIDEIDSIGSPAHPE